MTAGELAEQLEVSRPTISRDTEVLSAAGIPVAVERGLGGGWYLLEDTRPRDNDGWVTVAVQFQTEEETCGQLLGLGPQTQTAKPQSRPQKLMHLAASIVALYAQAPALTSRNDPMVPGSPGESATAMKTEGSSPRTATRGS